jgi:leader peptidase (prepilin peptidase)/N-methyltransferase
MNELILALGLCVAVFGGAFLWAPHAMGQPKQRVYRLFSGQCLLAFIGALSFALLVFAPNHMVHLPWLSALLLLSIVDIQTQQIRITDLMIATACLIPFLFGPTIAIELIICGVLFVLLVGVKFVLRAIYKQNALGGADIWILLLMVIGLQGQPALVAAYVAICSSGLFGALALIAKKKSRRSAIPFIPFLTFGSIFSVFFSQPVLDWYLRWVGV